MTDKSKNLQIAYVGGGSRGWAWGLMSDLALEPELSGQVRLYDIDFDAARSNETIGNRVQTMPETVSKWEYKAVPTLGEALTGADIVIISILPGTFNEMMSDVHEPEKYGIYQSVGDTIGPGGTVRALRTIPMMVEIAEAVRTFAPEAWVINYTNPMTLCVRTLYHTFPGIKAFGCCHEVFGTQHLLADMVQERLGVDNVRREDIRVNVTGINHFTWLTAATYKGEDLMPHYAAFADQYFETGFEKGDKDHWMNSSFAYAHRVKFDLFRRFGAIAAAGDRHLAEFMPPWYLKDPETVKKWKFGLTTVAWRMERQQEIREKAARLVRGEEAFELKPTGEDGVRQIKALLGLGDLITNVNLPNEGQISNLPRESVVETNALFSCNSVRPVNAGEIPGPVHALVSRHINTQELTLQAALEKNYDKLFAAFVNDPLVTVSAEDADRLLKTMMENTKSYLRGWNI